jgi:hypothetical protein
MMPTLHSPGVIRPDETNGFALHVIFNPHHVEHRNSFCDGHDQSQARIHRFHDGIGCKRGRNENHTAVGAGFSNRNFNRVENRHVIHLLAAFAWCHAGHHFGTVLDALAGVKHAFTAGDPLDQDSRVLVDKNAHGFTLQDS